MISLSGNAQHNTSFFFISFHLVDVLFVRGLKQKKNLIIRDGEIKFMVSIRINIILYTFIFFEENIRLTNLCLGVFYDFVYSVFALARMEYRNTGICFRALCILNHNAYDVRREGRGKTVQFNGKVIDHDNMML